MARPRSERDPGQRPARRVPAPPQSRHSRLPSRRSRSLSDTRAPRTRAKLAEVAIRRQTRRSGLLIGEINGDARRASISSRRFLEEPASSDSPRASRCGASPPGFQPLRTKPRRGRRATMPEGDTIFRAARTLQRAIAGQIVTRFETAPPTRARRPRHAARRPNRGERGSRRANGC